MIRNKEFFMEIMEPVAALLEEKGRAYGNSFQNSGKIIEVLFPNGIPKDRYQDMLTIVRIIDKLFRIANHKRDPMGENPWQDVLGYAVLALANDKDK